MHRGGNERRRRGARWLVAVFFGALGGASCAVDLSESIEGRPCTPDGRCLPGYVCSEDNICVRKSTVSSGGQQGRTDAGAGGASSGGTSSGGSANGGTVGITASGGSAGTPQAGGSPGAGGTPVVEKDAGSGGAIVVLDASPDADASQVPPEGGPRDAAPDAPPVDAFVPDTGVPVGGILCRDISCKSGDYCCVSSYPGNNTPPPATAFSCVAGTGTCPYTFRCDSDGDCANGEVCCSRLSGGNWTAACATSCPATGIHLGCSSPDQCGGQICCGAYNLQLGRYNSTFCRATCGAALEFTICSTNADCSAPQQCADSPSLPGFRYCK